MARPDAATLRADPKAAAELPADDAGADEHLHATPQHPGFLRLRASRTAAADPPAGHPAVDGAGSTAAADVPTAGQQQQQSLQQMFQESMNTYMQMFNIPHSYAQEGMRLAQEDTPGTPQEEIQDQARKTQRRSSGQSSSSS